MTLNMAPLMLVGGPGATPAMAATVACVLAVGVLLWADRQGIGSLRVAAKLSASTAFVLTAWWLGALQSDYGQRVFIALLLGWLGDALLLSRRSQAFMAGLVAFLLSHLMFAAAFLTGALSLPAMLWAAGVALVFGIVVLRWLLPHTPAAFKLPVLAYVTVILAMCITAAGFADAAGAGGLVGPTGQVGQLGVEGAQASAGLARHGHALVLLAAVLFAISDLAVARDRFVQRAFSNHLWGWPLYFGAQLLFAWSVVLL